MSKKNDKNAAPASEDEVRQASDSRLTERQLKKLAKKKNKDKKKEIRHILMGSYFTLQDGRLASGGGKWISPLGVGDVAGSALLLGIKDKRYRYNSRLKASKQTFFAVTKAMSNIGRALSLDCAPDAAACYIKGGVFRPAVLVFEEVALEDNSKYLELNAYCGRSVFAFLSLRRAVSKFDKELPDTISRV